MTSLELRADFSQHEKHCSEKTDNHAVLANSDQREQYESGGGIPRGFAVFTNPVHDPSSSTNADPDSMNLSGLPQASVKQPEMYARNTKVGVAVYQNPMFCAKNETVGEESRALCETDTVVINRLYQSSASLGSLVSHVSQVSQVSRVSDQQYVDFRQEWSRIGKRIEEEPPQCDAKSGALKRFQGACIRRCVKQPMHAFKSLAGCYKPPITAQ